MNQFIIFKNASEGITAIPLEAISRLELELTSESGGQIVAAHDVPAEALYPRGTSFHYNALVVFFPHKLDLVSSMR